MSNPNIAMLENVISAAVSTQSVSYTHLDVYKRQILYYYNGTNKI